MLCIRTTSFQSFPFKRIYCCYFRVCLGGDASFIREGCTVCVEKGVDVHGRKTGQSEGRGESERKGRDDCQSLGNTKEFRLLFEQSQLFQVTIGRLFAHFRLQM